MTETISKTLGLVFALALSAGCVSREQNEREYAAFIDKQAETMKIGQAQPDRAVAEIEAKKAFEMSLKDAESARYKFGKFVRVYVGRGKDTEHGWALLVLVNAKNSFGAYTGFKRHVVFFGESGARDITEMINSRRAGII